MNVQSCNTVMINPLIVVVVVVVLFKLCVIDVEFPVILIILTNCNVNNANLPSNMRFLFVMTTTESPRGAFSSFDSVLKTSNFCTIAGF